MNLTGDRTTLKLNVSTLFLALIIIIEAAYIAYHVSFAEWFYWQHWVAGFVPALAMFIIRDRTYSYTFFFLHLVIAVEMFARCWSIYLGARVDPKVFLPEPILLILASLICLAAYVLWNLIGSIYVLITKFKTSKSS